MLSPFGQAVEAELRNYVVKRDVLEGFEGNASLLSVPKELGLT
jgi:hypothetical protein